MPLNKFYSSLLLLVLGCPVFVLSRTLPGRGTLSDSCVERARRLLHKITDVLNQTELFTGIHCSQQNMELNLETNTPAVCSPQGSTCSGHTSLDFDKESCITDIGKDLSHYYKLLSAKPEMLKSSVLRSLRELTENCFKRSLISDIEPNKVAADHQNTYSERLSLCKVLLGFKVRAITINRAMSHMNAAERTTSLNSRTSQHTNRS